MFKNCIKVRGFFKNEKGASLAEYALIIALILVGAGAALTALTTAVSDAITAGTDELTTATTPAP